MYLLQMAVMVFKRSVYETRRKPKALLRPKTRANLKEASHVSRESGSSSHINDNHHTLYSSDHCLNSDFKQWIELF